MVKPSLNRPPSPRLTIAPKINSIPPPPVSIAAQRASVVRKLYRPEPIRTPKGPSIVKRPASVARGANRYREF